jgi:hypothetical protein
LPSISLDVVDFDDINDSLLIYSSTEGKNVLVLETAQSNTRPRNIEWSDYLPFVLLTVVSLTVTVNLIVDESTYYINERLDCTKTVVGMGIVHA